MINVTYNRTSGKIEWTEVTGADHYKMTALESGNVTPIDIPLNAYARMSHSVSVASIGLAKRKKYTVTVTAYDDQQNPNQLDSGSVTIDESTNWRKIWKETRVPLLISMLIVGAMTLLMVFNPIGIKPRHSVIPPPVDTTVDMSAMPPITPPPSPTPTITPADDAAVAELREKIVELERKLATVASVTQTVVMTSAVSPAAPLVCTNATDWTNAAQLLRGGVVGNDNFLVFGQGNVIVRGNSNVVTVGGEVVVRDHLPTRQAATPAATTKVWPQDFAPTRVIKAEDCLLTSGIQSFSLPTDSIRAGEDIKVTIPGGWAVVWHSSATRDEIEVALDGQIITPDIGRVAAGGSNVHDNLRLRLKPGCQSATLELTFNKF